MKEKKGKLNRANGVIMPIFSIPSAYGIGTLGKEAYEVVDFLSEANIHYWQILPLGPTSYGDSPYQSFSSFAGNPYFIDLDLLEEDGLLAKQDYANVDFGENKNYIDYAKMYNNRFGVLEKAYKNAKGKLDKELKDFRKKEAYWIEDYALYMAIKKEYLDVSWLEFPEDLRNRKKTALNKFYKENKDKVDFYVFIQYEFFKQWENLKAYTNRHKIEIIGDLPIYLALDSSDAWANSDILQLDQKKSPLAVGGCPPDGFSDDGQLWGNPLYDWDTMEKDNFSFWEKRLEMNLRLVDLLRLDHFRGFEAYYQIPATDDTAKYGKWVKAKPYQFFKMVKEKFPTSKFIAEDLGFITDQVKELMDFLAYPGMNVIQFAFGEDFTSSYLPHNYKRNSIVYSSTHDSDTLMGWLKSLDEDKMEMVKAYFDLEGDDLEENLWKIIKRLMASVAAISMFEIQDFLALDNQARVNSPGTLGENWKWRANKEDFKIELAQKIKDMSRLYERG
ncbi:MAG: 4-alpha-glucanotransferase [Peptoniphilaceae bacterium]|nr:4-alpha-glucanotransferase [Peptoniphilaceae bacterium]MDY6018231.1 4-alpha-glucanotransferase [Anaerococcus sp.]